MLALREAPFRSRQIPVAHRVKTLALVLCEEFGIPWLFYDGSTGELADDQEVGREHNAPTIASPRQVVALAAESRPHVSLVSTGRYRLALSFHEAESDKLVAVGELPALARSPKDMLLEQTRLQKWLQSVQSRLTFTGGSINPYRSEKPNQDQLRALLGAFHELNDLLGDWRVPGESAHYQDYILKRVLAVLPVETLIWVPADEQETVAIVGRRVPKPTDCVELASVLSRSPEWDTSGCMIQNDVPSSRLGTLFPGITNLIALSVGESNTPGWLIALNKVDVTIRAYRPPGLDGHVGGLRLDASSSHGQVERPSIAAFRRIDTALLMPFASLLALQSRSSRRQVQIQELFAGLIGSLTASFETKDPYTFGHSERVARIGMELGRELGLPERTLGDIYLAGLLHDIGKIGVPDSILCKTEPLTTEEFSQIRRHVIIGCKILRDFQAISHLLPFVLHHHERYDGTGYPNELKGDAIPLPARILAVADSFDAMSTSRSYRPALPLDQIEEILVQGRNEQWDGNVIDAFFRARERVDSIHNKGPGDSAWSALCSLFR